MFHSSDLGKPPWTFRKIAPAWLQKPLKQTRSNSSKELTRLLMRIKCWQGRIEDHYLQIYAQNIVATLKSVRIPCRARRTQVATTYWRLFFHTSQSTTRVQEFKKFRSHVQNVGLFFNATGGSESSRSLTLHPSWKYDSEWFGDFLWTESQSWYSIVELTDY